MDIQERTFNQIRQLAEDLLTQRDNGQDNTSDKIARLLDELSVHQVQLQVQTEELQRTQESREELRDLFDHAPVAYFIIDGKGLIRQANQTAVTKFRTTRQAIYGQPFAQLISPDEQNKYLKYLRRLIQQSPPQSIGLWFTCETVDPFYGQMECIAFDEKADDKLFRVAISDITERKVYENRLESLLELDQMILNHSPIAEIVAVALDSLQESSPYTYSSIIVFDDDQQIANGYIKDMNLHPKEIQHVSDDTALFENILSLVGDDNQLITNSNHLPQSVRSSYPIHRLFPIKHRENLKGFLIFGTEASDEFDTFYEEFVQRIARHLGAAIQQKEHSTQIQHNTTALELEVEERNRKLHTSQQFEHEQRLFAEGLLSIVQQINQTPGLNQILENVLSCLGNLVAYDGAQIIIPGDDHNDVIFQSKGELKLHREDSASPFEIEHYPVYLRVIRNREVVWIKEVTDRDLLGDQSINCYLGVPIQSGKQLLGLINVYSRKVDHFTEQDILRVQAFATQAAVAVTNARSTQEGQELATLEERQRLAHDLQDAVSQLIFAISTMTESLSKRINKGDFERAAEIADTIRTSAASAYAEMRLLLLELRPMRFAGTPLEELFKQLSIAFIERNTTTQVQIETEQSPPLSIEVKNNLYRIVQEVLNNVTQHSHAEIVNVRLWIRHNVMHITAEDNGIGFDTTRIASGNGLRNIAERAAQIGAELLVSSQIGKGTQIHIKYPLDR